MLPPDTAEFVETPDAAVVVSVGVQGANCKVPLHTNNEAGPFGVPAGIVTPPAGPAGP